VQPIFLVKKNVYFFYVACAAILNPLKDWFKLALSVIEANNRAHELFNFVKIHLIFDSMKSPLRNLNQVLLLLVLIFAILHYAKSFLVPIAISALLAMMLVPVCRKLQQWGLHLILSAALSVIATLLVFLGIAYLLINQLVVLSKDLPTIVEKFQILIDQFNTYMASHFQLTVGQKQDYVLKQLESLPKAAGKYAGDAFLYLMNFFANILIITTYTLLFLIYRQRIKNFIQMLVQRYAGSGNLEATNHVVEKITGVASSYLSGVFSVVLILSVIYTIGLTIIGVDNALFFALLAALINVIPYVGSVGGAIIVVAYTLITRDTLTTPIAVALFFTIVQQVDSYYLTPKITGGKVQLSPLFTIMALLLGAMVWGLAGMLLFIPFMGVLKVIFDEVEQLKPYGYLISE
jgi:predicted PurR-regulated permease PerM